MHNESSCKSKRQLEEWPILQSLPLTWNKSCLQAPSYSCNLLYVKQSNHSRCKAVNSVRESKNLEMKEQKHLTQTLNYRWKAIFILPGPVFSFQLQISLPFLFMCSVSSWTVRPTQTLSSLIITSTFKSGIQLFQRWKPIFKAIYVCYQSRLFIDLHAH